MKKILIIAVAQLVLAGTALASGYGGVDQEYVEVSPIEIAVTGGDAATCEISKENVSANVKITGCEEKFVLDSSCSCKENENVFVCEYKQVISCTAAYQYH